MAGKSRLSVPYRLVLLEWTDSSQPVSAWDWAENYKTPETILCVSVGYLIGDTPEAVALAPNIGDVGHEITQASGIICIPRCAIRRVADLRLR